MSNDNSILDYYTGNVPEYYPTMYLDDYKPWQILFAESKESKSIDDLKNAHQVQDNGTAQRIINLKGQVTINGRKV